MTSDYRPSPIWAGSSGDYDGAKYAVDLIKDDQIRALALLTYANNSGRMTLDDLRRVAAMADEAIRQIERTGPIRFSVCEIGNTRSLLTHDTSTDKYSGSDREDSADNEPVPPKFDQPKDRHARAI